MKQKIEWTLFLEMSHEWVNPEERGLAMQRLFLQESPVRGWTIAKYLQEKGIKLAIATNSLDAPTAEALQMLKMPVTLWITIEDEHDYWANAASCIHTSNRIAEAMSWAQVYGIPVERIGLDFEPPLTFVKALNQGRIFEVIKQFFAFKKASLPGAAGIINQTLGQYRVEVEYYVFPGILAKLMPTGIKPPRAAREITMMYTSMLPGFLRKLFLKLHGKHQIPAFGIVNGAEGQTPGRMLANGLPGHLTAKQLAADIAYLNPTEAYLFALNGVEVLRTLEIAENMLK